jgi:ABC-type Fe3+-siderophore transport system permease subunit
VRTRYRGGKDARGGDRGGNADHGKRVAISGVIGGFGLGIPHIARLIVGTNFERRLSTAKMMGAAYLVLVKTLARSSVE